MDRFTARDDMMTRILALSGRYQLDDTGADDAIQKVNAAGAIAGQLYAAGYLSALTVEAAEVHAVDCPGGCRCCYLFSRILAVSLTLVRQEIDRELARKMNDA